ncbi:acyl-CoA-binding protein (ACBP)/diazepam binding inhibitor (DBI)/endozepine (EP) [Collariella sp. IMI 366227]|nr:acyl-CoA-binding protein (ACBP)/diazepam binding inhibitor (DBI)/endozepine (EP) [Collariella sp. IMI 366227]
MVAQSEAFQKAVVDSKKLTSKPSNDDLLELYALYKIGTGEDIEKASMPGMFDLKASHHRPVTCAPETNTPQGKAKYNAWRAAVDDALTPEKAQENYVAKIEAMKGTYGYDADKVPEAVGGQ